MPVSSGTSFALASISAVLIFSGMQMYKPWLVSTQFHTIFAGYLGSIFFFLVVTACGNLESCVFGKAIQLKLPEVVICLCIAMFSAGTVHRVSATTCLLFSIVALYYINKYSQKVYSTPAPTTALQTGKKRK